MRVRAGKPEPLTFVLGLDTRAAVDLHVARLHRGRAPAGGFAASSRVAVAVLGGIGPFFGSYEFIREEAARERPPSPHG